MRKYLLAAIGLLAMPLMAQNLFVGMDKNPQAWSSKAVTYADSIYGIKTGKVLIVRSLPMAIDPAKKYRLSGDFRSLGGVNIASLGVIFMNKNNQLIYSQNVEVMPGTETVLTKPVAKGAKELFLKDCKKWEKRRSRRTAVAFNVKPNLGDLPNFRVSSLIDRTKRTPDKTEWLVKLKQPMPYALAAGTPVRQHRCDYRCSHVFAYRKIGAEWKNYVSEPITGRATLGTAPDNQLWAGAEKCVIMILANASGNASELQFKNLKFEEIKD